MACAVVWGRVKGAVPVAIAGRVGAGLELGAAGAVYADEVRARQARSRSGAGHRQGPGQARDRPGTGM